MPATACTPSATPWTPASSSSRPTTRRQPIRFLAEGRDASATYRLALRLGPANDGDNEITGIHVSDGDPTRRPPRREDAAPFSDGWRVFWTQQHGDNVTFEITPAATARNGNGNGH